MTAANLFERIEAAMDDDGLLNRELLSECAQELRQQAEALEKFCALAERDAEEIARLRERVNDAERNRQDAEARLKVALDALRGWVVAQDELEMMRPNWHQTQLAAVQRAHVEAREAIAAIDAAPSEAT